MAWVNFGIFVGGSALVAIPIVLHLIMRRQPKPHVFPALRFVKQRKEVNQRQLELRHWLLLLLRCAAIALLAAALARPSAASADFSDWIFAGGTGLLFFLAALLALAAWIQERGAWLSGGLGSLAAVLLAALVFQLWQIGVGSTTAILGDDEAPVAAAVVFDTAPRMDYRYKNQTRLERAKEVSSEWLLGEFASDSEIFVLGTRPGETTLPADLASARSAIAGLKTHSTSRPVIESLTEALQLVVKSEQARKEIWLFSDLTEPAWRTETAAGLKAALAEQKDVSVYVIDVGAPDPVNFGLTDLRLTSGQSLAPGMSLRIEADVQHTGPGGAGQVELYVEELDLEKPFILDGKVQLPNLGPVKAQQPFEITTVPAVTVPLPAVGGIGPGTHHGIVKLVRGDSLAVDDVRHFTFEVRDAWPVLVVAGKGAEPALFTQAVAPDELVRTGQSRFACESIAQAKLPEKAEKDLARYKAVVLLDPGPLVAEEWKKLEEFARAGGGVAVFLGRNAFPADTFNEAAAQAVLGGKLGKQPQRSTTRNVYLDPRGNSHPLLQVFSALASGVPWFKYPVTYHWRIAEENLVPGSVVAMRYTNRAPALIDRRIGKGRVLTMTTPVSDAPASRPWNDLATSLEAWPFVMLANESLLYLVQTGDTRLNYLAGEPASLAKQSDRDPDRYQLFAPGANYSAPIVARDGLIRVDATDALGTYRLRAEGAARLLRGFSVNLPADASRLDRTSPARLDAVLGAGRYHLAREPEEIERDVGEARRGKEFYPLLVIMLAIVLGLELLMANRFYGEAK